MGNRTTIVTRRLGTLKDGYYACTRHHRARFLGDYDPVEFGGVVRLALRGSFVAYVIDECDPGACYGNVSSVNLRTGERVGTKRGRLRASAFPGLVVTGRGAVGWLQVVDGGVEVHALKPGSDDRVLDAGSVDYSSLAFEGGNLYWLKDGSARTARL